MQHHDEIDVRLLGPVEIAARDGTVAVGGPRTRALVAVLALARGKAVPRDRIVDVLWSEEPPRRAKESVQMHVSRVRRGLKARGVPGDRLVAVGDGYRLVLRKGECDLDRWEDALERARDARAGGDRTAARALLDDALALWRGEPLSGIGCNGALTPERARLDEQQLGARLERLELALDDGEAAAVVGELERLAAAHPYQETAARHLMLALYRAGRQADALEVFAALRRRLVDDLGLEPGEGVRGLQEAILRQDPDLLGPSAVLAPELAPQTAFVGRSGELAWLEARWSEARAGRGAVVAVTGRAGSGRTRLAAELAVRVHALGVRVTYARGAAPEAPAALAAAAGAQRPALVVLDDVDEAPQSLLADIDAVVERLVRRPALVLLTATEPRDAPHVDALVRRLGAVDGHRHLGPLDDVAVERIAAGYAPVGAAIPLHDLLAASGGFPERVHRAAWTWARAETAKRVARAGAQTRERQSALNAVEATLAGDVAELERLRRRRPAPERPHAPPFRGLAAFEGADAGTFFGRERLTAAAVARLTGGRLIVLVGASGSGKSSLLRAGLLPALAAGALPELEGASHALLRPGAAPLEALRRTTAREPEALAAAPLVLAVDQLEELFAAGVAQDERIAFLDALVAAAGDPRGHVAVLLTLRSDFYPSCAAHPSFTSLLDRHTLLVGAMRADELRAAIELPAQVAGVRVDPELVDALVADVRDEPGALPLLSTTLLELWERRTGPRLALAEYRQVGGVRGAIARLAERVFGRLTAEQQRASRRILTHLAATESGVVLRRQVPLADLRGDAPAIVDETLAVFVGGRLLVVDGNAVEVAHEALFSEWPRLASWLAEDAEALRARAHLTRAATEWTARGRDPADLYRGARLASALDVATAVAPGAVEREFLDASRALAAAETTRIRRTNRRLRTLVAVGAVLLCATVAGALVADGERERAHREATVAQAERLGAQALIDPRLDRSLLMAVAGNRIHDAAATRSNLLAALLRSTAAIGEWHGDGGRLLSLEVSPDGRRVAVGDNGGTLLVFHATDPSRAPGRVELGNLQIHDLAFSADGDLLAAAGTSPLGGWVELVDARTGRRLRRLEPADTIGYTGVTFAAGGGVVIAGTVPAPPGGRASVRSWDTRTGRTIGRPARLTSRDILKLGLVPGAGHVLVTGARSGAVLLDRDGRHLRTFPGAAPIHAVAPDGRRFVTGSLSGELRVFDLATGADRRLGGRTATSVQALAYTPGGGRIVIATDDGRLTVRDARTGDDVETLTGHTARVPGVTVSPDGATAYSAALDNTIIRWDLRGSRRLGRSFAAGRVRPDHPSFAISRAGDIAIPQQDGTILLRSTAHPGVRRSVTVTAGVPVTGVAFAPDGRSLAAAGEDGRVRLVDLRSSRVGRAIRAHRGMVASAAFDDGGRLLATAGWDRTAALWRMPRGDPAGRLRLPSDVNLVDLSPDGTRLAVARDLSPAEVYDVRTRRRVARLGPGDAATVTFAPDGRTLAVGGIDGRVRLWRTADWRLDGPPLGPHAGFASFVAFDPRGHRLATGSNDGIRLWDRESRQLIGTPLPVPTNLAAPAFSPDGRQLVTVYANGRGFVWDVTRARWLEHACEVAGRGLTRTEWRALVPGRRYDPVCRER